MRFNAEAYEKVFPQNVETPASIESAVDTFKPTEAETKATEEKPTEAETKATEEKPGEDVMSSVPSEEPDNDSDQNDPEGGTNE